MPEFWMVGMALGLHLTGESNKAVDFAVFPCVDKQDYCRKCGGGQVAWYMLKISSHVRVCSTHPIQWICYTNSITPSMRPNPGNSRPTCYT